MYQWAGETREKVNESVARNLLMVNAKGKKRKKSVKVE